MKISGIVNESACLYFILKCIKNNRRNALLVVEDSADLLFFYQTAISLKDLIDKDIEIIEYDSSINSCVKLSKLILDNSNNFLAISSMKSFNEYTFDPSFVRGKNIKVGDIFNRFEFIDLLVKNGFKKTDFVELAGEFATRGSVVDVFNPGDDYPVRIYFDDNKIYAIKKFEIDTQNTFDFIMELNLTNISHRTKRVFELELDFYCYNLKIDKCFELSSLPDENRFSFENIVFDSFKSFSLELARLSQKGFTTHIYYLNEREGIKIFSLLEETGKIFKNIYFHQGYIRKGFYSEIEKIFLVSSNEIFGRDFIVSRRKEIKKSLSINQITSGDYVVHSDYGIGIYNGIIDYTHRDEWGNIYTTECIEIKYAGGDKLYVALEDFNKIEKYIGSSDKIKLSSLNSVKWTKVKENIRKEIEKIAHEIVKIDAQRKLIKTIPMLKTEMEDDFVSDFIYEETPDQKKAIDDVLKDLESERPANRVIIGDVGFGKTEVAMRAAFRAVSNGWQVCVLCPTTILVEQHFRTFSMRFKRFPFNIASLSRFTISSDEKRIKNNIERGVIDILIGTHKVLSENIRFKNLGVLIIDEEHKFGVKQKEIIKSRYSNVHIFYLSATPIPRTLYQSLSSIRDMSIIETPPLGRLPIETKVCAYSDDIIVNAVDRELKRGGQVFYVYNRVEFINQKYDKLQKLLPGVRICVVHGKMKGKDIERTMYDFLNRKYDFMLSSTIIESGIDIPSVNTLIVEDAHKMGLAQAYQIRGRIGREKTKAYCYFLYPKYMEKEFIKNIDDTNKDAVKRLLALEEFSELGSGFRLSMRDLEIRGAGEILGTKQHGFIASVGLETYIRLLNYEISKVKGVEIKERKEPIIDLKISAYIPHTYINNDMERLIFYRKLKDCNYKDIEHIVKEMEDLSGPLAVEVKNLIRIIKIKKLISDKKIYKIVEKDGFIEFYFEKGFEVGRSDIDRWQRDFKGRINFFKTPNYNGLLIILGKDDDKISIVGRVFDLDI